MFNGLYSQVDFDDGHCPTWRNTIQGIYNVHMAVNGKLPGAPIDIESCPILMLRPRAWNMYEHHCIVRGIKIKLTSNLCISSSNHIFR